MNQTFKVRDSLAAKRSAVMLAVSMLMVLAACGGSDDETVLDRAKAMAHPWMSKEITREQRAQFLISAMTTSQKFEQLIGQVGQGPEIPECYGIAISPVEPGALLSRPCPRGDSHKEHA